MTKVLYLAEPIDQAGNLNRWPVERLHWYLKHQGWAIYRPWHIWSIGTKAEPGPEVDEINREALARSHAVVAHLPEGVPTIGVPREIELARGYGIPVAVLRPDGDKISWALQDVSVFETPHQVAEWLKLEQLDLIKYRGMVFQVGPDGRLPDRAHDGDAGFDLYAAQTATIEPGGYENIRTDVSVALPTGIWARITGRSSTWRKRGLMAIEGVIDTGYRGELFVGLLNLGKEPSTIHEGERLAQLIPHINLNGSLSVDLVDRATFDSIPAVDGRGTNGFGSSGT